MSASTNTLGDLAPASLPGATAVEHAVSAVDSAPEEGNNALLTTTNPLAVSAVDSAPTVSAVDSAPKEGNNALLTTTNPDKLADYRVGLAALGIRVEAIEIETNEIDAEWKPQIDFKAKEVAEKLQKKGIDQTHTIAIVDDTVFEIGKFKFPGPGTKKLIQACTGNLHLLPTLLKCGSKDVTYRSSAAVILPSGETITITATTMGYFAEKRSKDDGCSGKGWIDTQLVPYDDPEQRTISQMPLADRMKYHPRFKLILLIIEELRKRFSF